MVNRIWPTAVADSVSSVSASACHIGGPNSVNPGQIRLVYGSHSLQSNLDLSLSLLFPHLSGQGIKYHNKLFNCNINPTSEIVIDLLTPFRAFGPCSPAWLSTMWAALIGDPTSLRCSLESSCRLTSLSPTREDQTPSSIYMQLHTPGSNTHIKRKYRLTFWFTSINYRQRPV